MTDEPKPNLVAVPFPHANANTQKGLAAIGGMTITYEDGTPDHLKKAAQNHMHLVIAWCKLRPHVTKSKVVPLRRKSGKRKGRRTW